MLDSIPDNENALPPYSATASWSSHRMARSIASRSERERRRSLRHPGRGDRHSVTRAVVRSAPARISSSLRGYRRWTTRPSTTASVMSAAQADGRAAARWSDGRVEPRAPASPQFPGTVDDPQICRRKRWGSCDQAMTELATKGSIPASTMALRSRASPERIRLLTVPSGTPSSDATST